LTVKIEKLLTVAKSVGFIIAVTVISFVFLAPVFWGISTSLKEAKDIIAVPPQLIPLRPTLENYDTLVKNNVLLYLKNSLLNSSLTVLLVIGVGSLVSYGFARFDFPGKSLLLVIVICTMTIPTMCLLIPSFYLFAQLNAVNKWFTLILFYSAHNLPFAIWLMKGFFETIPPEMENAAMVDGYTRVQAMYKVLLPLTKPGLITAALFTFLAAWNDYIVAVTMTSADSLRTLPVAMQFYLGYWGRQWGPLTGAAMISVVPAIVLFLLFRDYFVGGLVSGAVKG
jgi:multiple sugar transport system permease protein